MVCIIQVVGPSGSGKTSLIVEILRRLKEMGLRVAVIKHTHHDIDTPHKDSWRFLEEGGADYSIVVKGSGERVAVFTRGSLESVLEDLEGKVDIVLVEGFKDLELGYKVSLTPGVDINVMVDNTLNYILRCLNLKPKT